MSIDNIKILFSPYYLFTPYPGYDMKYLVPLLVIFGLMVILSIVSYIFSKKNKKHPIAKFWELVHNWLLWVGLVGLSLLFFRYEGVAYLGMRFLLLLWILVFIGWGVAIVIYYRKGYKKLLKEYQEKKSKEKYTNKR